MSEFKIPEPIEIDPFLYARLIKSQDTQMAVQTMLEMFRKNCEQRIIQSQEEVRQIWREIGEKHGVDYSNTIWQPHPTKANVIIPIQIALPTQKG